jgi:hypothetical protein
LVGGILLTKVAGAIDKSRGQQVRGAESLTQLRDVCQPLKSVIGNPRSK